MMRHYKFQGVLYGPGAGDTRKPSLHKNYVLKHLFAWFTSCQYLVLCAVLIFAAEVQSVNMTGINKVTEFHSVNHKYSSSWSEKGLLLL